jgi:hypothetical protein
VSRVQGKVELLEFRVFGLGFRVWSLKFTCTVASLGFRVQGFESKVYLHSCIACEMDPIPLKPTMLQCYDRVANTSHSDPMDTASVLKADLVQGSGFRVQGPGFRLQVLGQCPQSRLSSGFRVQGSGSRV